jgi:hypothetical protein
VGGRERVGYLSPTDKKGKIMEQRISLAYAGRRLKQTGGLAYKYVEIESGATRLYKSQLIKGQNVGTLTSYAQTDDGSILVSSTKPELQPQTIGEYNDPVAVKQWAAQEAADVVLDAREKQNRRRDREVNPPLAGAVAELRIAYQGLRGVGQRAAFIDWVNASIQGAR